MNNTKSDLTSNSLSNSKNVLTYNDWRQKRNELLEEKNKVEEKSLESTKETLGLIIESERIGIKTGKELVRQRETLNRVEDKLVTINGHLNESQQHLNSMKSVFNSFKGYFSRKPNSNSHKRHENDLIEVNRFEFESKNIPIEGQNEKLSKTNPNLFSNENDSTILSNGVHNETVKYWQKSNDLNEKIENNLDQIDSGVQRLKQLTLNLGQEIDSQNSLIDNITKESERAKQQLKQQNQEIRRLLKK